MCLIPIVESNLAHSPWFVNYVIAKKMNLLPIERRAQILGPEEFVNSLRGRAAGKAKAKTFRHAGNARGDKARDQAGQSLRAVSHFDNRRGRHVSTPKVRRNAAASLWAVCPP